MLNLYAKTKLKSSAHNRWWSNENIYAKQNGGIYDFLIDNQLQIALPIDQQFWNDLFQNASSWGLHTYEQDWLIKQTEKFGPLLEDVNLGRLWLLQMGHAAKVQNITIQYCMALSRHILQSLEIPQVTSARVSTDYDNSLASIFEQWRIGISSMVAHALRLAPFKDVFWTTEYQPGNPYDTAFQMNVSEPNTELECAVATLSCGPVGPGDKIGLMNKSVIMRCCNNDGLILKPTKPIMVLDAQLQAMVFSDPARLTNVGEIWSTHTTLKTNENINTTSTFGIVLAADIQRKFYVTPENCGFLLTKVI